MHGLCLNLDSTKTQLYKAFLNNQKFGYALEIEDIYEIRLI